MGRGPSSAPPIGSRSLRTRRNEYPTSGELAVFAGGNLEIEAIAVAVEADLRGLGDKRQGAGESVSRSDPHAEARLRATVISTIADYASLICLSIDGDSVLRQTFDVILFLSFGQVFVIWPSLSPNAYSAVNYQNSP
jgi:hypothetical protein